MNVRTDRLRTESQFNAALTSYCFGDLSEADREAVEHHLFECDACWRQFQTLDAAVRAMLGGDALQPSLSPAGVVSLLGLSGRLPRRFGGHTAFASAVSILFGLEWVAGVWTELVYRYDQFGRLAWTLSVPVGLGAAAALAAALWLLASSARDDRTDGFLRSTVGLLVAIVAMVVAVMIVLPHEPTIRASFQTRSSASGFLKDVLFLFIPLLLFILPPFQTVVSVQRELRAGRYAAVLRFMTHRAEGVATRGAMYLSVKTLGAVLAVLGAIKIAGTNYMLDQLSPGPYAFLFSLIVYASNALWFGIVLISLLWYSSSLNELKREVVVLESLRGHEPVPGASRR